jgi:flagellar protein FlaG
MGINQVSGQAATYVAPEASQRTPRADVPTDQRPVPTPVAQSDPQPVQGQTAATQISHRQVEESLQRIKESLKTVASNNLEFSIDDTTGQTVVKVVDSSTKELIRQIPSEEMLAIAQALDGEIKGLLVRNKA